VVGPPGYGKTAGILIPAVLHWSGPMVSSSTRGDVLAATGDRRADIAAAAGGRVYVYDPFGSEIGVTSIGWSPLTGCQDASLAYRRVAAMTAAAGKGVENAEHFRLGAARLLRGYFHAAAIGDFTMTQVRRWLATQDVGEACEVIRTANGEGIGWADDLESVLLLGERERGSFYSFALNALDATAEPKVLASTEVAGLDVDEFLATRSSLYVVGPSHYQDVVAPLIVGLIESIAQRAAELAARSARGRLEQPLLLALDEVANTAPVRSLPALVSEFGGRGICTLWTVQNLSQLRERYGDNLAASILSATTAKIIYGGLSNGADLRDISGWAGEHRVTQTTYYSGEQADWRRSPATPGGLGERRESGREHAVGSIWRPVLPVEAIQGLPKVWAWLYYQSDRPQLVATPPAALVAGLAAAGGYHPAPVEVSG
jgi:type IV secretory pathway TraG/TraD family ATPase VirD4